MSVLGRRPRSMAGAPILDLRALDRETDNYIVTYEWPAGRRTYDIRAQRDRLPWKELLDSFIERNGAVLLMSPDGHLVRAWIRSIDQEVARAYLGTYSHHVFLKIEEL